LGALEDFGKGLDFADALLGRVNRRLGCEYTATFDRKAARHPGFRRL
jgi:predicted nucleic-acid-binding protein